MTKAKTRRKTTPAVDFPGRARLTAERQILRRAHRLQRQVASLAKQLITVTTKADAALVDVDRFILTRVGAVQRELAEREPIGAAH